MIVRWVSVSRRDHVLTVSDSVAAGVATDRNGGALVEQLASAGFIVENATTKTEGAESVARALCELAVDFSGLIVTTGGSELSPSDQTPEGTLLVLEREAPGLAEAMRAVNPLARLSRGVAGTVGGALVLNLPGSPHGALESLGAVLDVLGHALDLLAGADPLHGDRPRSPTTRRQPPEISGRLATSSSSPNTRSHDVVSPFTHAEQRATREVNSGLWVAPASSIRASIVCEFMTAYREPVTSLIWAKNRTTGTSSPDHRHRPASARHGHLVIAEPGALVPHRTAQGHLDHRCTPPRAPVHAVGLLLRKEAVAQVAVGGEAKPVACGTERLRHRGHHSDLPHTVAEPEPFGRRRVAGRRSPLEGLDLADLRDDLSRGRDEIRRPRVRSVQWHELNEEDRPSGRPRKCREHEDLVVIDAGHQDDVNFHRLESGCLSGVHRREHRCQITTTANFGEPLGAAANRN